MLIGDCLYEMGAKELYIMLGLNDHAGSAPYIYRDLYQTAMNKVTARNPGIVIRVQSCTPVGKTKEKPSLNNANIDYFNELLKEMCDESGYEYIDIASPMKIDNNSFNPLYTSDKDVHMSNEGCVVWIRALRSFARQKYFDGEWRPDADPEDFPGEWVDVGDQLTPYQ